MKIAPFSLLTLLTSINAGLCAATGIPDVDSNANAHEGLRGQQDLLPRLRGSLETNGERLLNVVGCCSQNYMDCVSLSRSCSTKSEDNCLILPCYCIFCQDATWCGSTQTACETCSGGAGMEWLESGALAAGSCLKRTFVKKKTIIRVLLLLRLTLWLSSFVP